MILSMYIRDALEDFHVHDLPDAQMKIVNRTFRQALYDFLSVIEQDDGSSEPKR